MSELNEVCTVKVIPFWVFMMRDIQNETGWRVAEVCNLRYENINWIDSEIQITRAKETKAAMAKAPGKAAAMIRFSRMSRAKDEGDSDEFMRQSLASDDEIIATATRAEQRIISTTKLEAKKYTSKKRVSQKLLNRIAKMHDEAPSDDGWIFSAALTRSNSTSGKPGSPITRQTAWARIKQLNETLETIGAATDEALFDMGLDD